MANLAGVYQQCVISESKLQICLSRNKVDFSDKFICLQSFTEIYFSETCVPLANSFAR